MYCVKIIGKELYMAKTPYKEKEWKNGFLTSDPLRIAKYKHRGTAETRAKLLRSERTEPIEVTIIT